MTDINTGEKVKGKHTKRGRGQKRNTENEEAAGERSQVNRYA